MLYQLSYRNLVALEGGKFWYIAVDLGRVLVDTCVLLGFERFRFPNDFFATFPIPMLFARWRSQDLIFLTPYTAAPGFKPTSDSRVAPYWDFWRTLHRLSYSAAAGFQKTKLIKRTRLAPHRWLHFWPASISPMLPIHGQVTFSAGQEDEELWRLRNR